MSQPKKEEEFVPMPPSSTVPGPSNTVTPAPAVAGAVASSPASTTSGLAIAGFVCSLAGLLFWLVVPLVGLVLSIIGLNQTKGGKRKGRGLAIAGIIISSLTMIWGVLWLVIFVISAANTASNTNDYNYTSSDLSSISSSKSTVVSGNVAETVTVEKVDLTVREVKRGYVPESKYYTPDAGKEYIAVSVELKNTGSESISFSSYSFTVRDSAGLELNDAYVGGVTGELESGSLAANGGSTTGVIIFEVPTADTGLVLIYEPSYFDGEVAEIKL